MFSPVLCFSQKNLFEIIAHLASPKVNLDENKIIELLKNREQIGSTYVANGFAFPHAIINDDLKETALFITLDKQIHFNYLDNYYADCFLVLFIHKETALENEKYLMNLCNELSDNAICKYIRSIKNIQTHVYNTVINIASNLEEETAKEDTSEKDKEQEIANTEITE